MTGVLSKVVETCKWTLEKLIAPLRTGDGPKQFRLSTAETATTTYEGDVGWAKRPPAVVRCDRCGNEIFQHNARDDIDCPHCVGHFEHDEFPDLELIQMTCPVCKSQMRHGRRHPEKVDFPEWATCDDCRYHWEFKHSYDQPTDRERVNVR